jgi:hypothetical protein
MKNVKRWEVDFLLLTSKGTFLNGIHTALDTNFDINVVRVSVE